MTPRARRLLADALELPDDVRAELASAPVDSLYHEVDPPVVVEASWSAEIQRRIHDIESGAVKTIPWEQARRIIFADQ